MFKAYVLHLKGSESLLGAKITNFLQVSGGQRKQKNLATVNTNTRPQRAIEHCPLVPAILPA